MALFRTHARGFGRTILVPAGLAKPVRHAAFRRFPALRSVLGLSFGSSLGRPGLTISAAPRRRRSPAANLCIEPVRPRPRSPWPRPFAVLSVEGDRALPGWARSFPSPGGEEHEQKGHHPQNAENRPHDGAAKPPRGASLREFGACFPERAGHDVYAPCKCRSVAEQQGKACKVSASRCDPPYGPTPFPVRHGLGRSRPVGGAWENSGFCANGLTIWHHFPVERREKTTSQAHRQWANSIKEIEILTRIPREKFV